MHNPDFLEEESLKRIADEYIDRLLTYLPRARLE